MRVSIRELRNHTAAVVAAVKAGEAVTLTAHGEPVADIVPHRRRARWLPGDRLADQLRDRQADPGRRAGIRPRVLDALIGATAVEHGLPVVTQDAGFAAIAGAHPPLVVVRA
jgi:prevent-host-death family protein